MKYLLLSLFIVFCLSSNSQTTIAVTVDTVYFFIFRNDTVVLEPTMVTPGMSVTSNYTQVGAEMYISDTMQKCVDRIGLGLIESDYSIVNLYTDENILFAYVIVR